MEDVDQDDPYTAETHNNIRPKTPECVMPLPIQSDATGLHDATSPISPGSWRPLPGHDFETRFGKVRQATKFMHEGEYVSISTYQERSLNGTTLNFWESVKLISCARGVDYIFQVYAMYKKVRGKCLIVNNEKFDNHQEREGSAVDAANLEFLFGKLGFQVSNLH